MTMLVTDMTKTPACPGYAPDGAAPVAQGAPSSTAKPSFVADLAMAQAGNPPTDGVAPQPPTAQAEPVSAEDTALPETLARLLAAPAQGTAAQAEAGANALSDTALPGTESAETMAETLALPGGAKPLDEIGSPAAAPLGTDAAEPVAPVAVQLAPDTLPDTGPDTTMAGQTDATSMTTDQMPPDAAGQPPQTTADSTGSAPMPGADAPPSAPPQTAAVAQDTAAPDPVQAATATPLIVVTDATTKDARAQRGDAAPMALPGKDISAATVTQSRPAAPTQGPDRAPIDPKGAGPDLRGQTADQAPGPKPGPMTTPKADLPPILIDAPVARLDPAPPVTLSILQATTPPGQTMGQTAMLSGPTLITTQPDWPRDLAATLTETATLRRLGAGEMLEIRLDPETLGPVTLRLDLRDGTANVSIVTQTPEAARLFTDTQHRLADAMARAGLELGSHSAGTGDGRAGQTPQDRRGQPGSGGPAPHDTQADSPALTLAQAGPGRRIDLFA